MTTETAALVEPGTQYKSKSVYNLFDLFVLVHSIVIVNCYV